MNRTGPAPQSLRGMPGFPTQQQAQARNAAISSLRLPNGKLGSGANWNFNLPMSGTPSLQTSQQRGLSGLGTFAQSVGGSQPATPLDLSEFPSLSGAQQQSQSQNLGQLVWANASQRATQQTPVQRQQHPGPSATSSRAGQSQNHISQPHTEASNEDIFSSESQFGSRLEEFRNSGQGISGQLGGIGQPQTGNIEEFPPLGRNVQMELNPERRGSLLQNASFGNFNALGFPATQSTQARGIMAASINGQDVSRMMSSANAGAGGISTSRSPVNQGTNGVIAQDKEDLNSLLAAQRGNIRPDGLSEQQSGQAQLQQMQQRTQPTGVLGDARETSAANQNTEPPLSQMSELDRFGLAGLLRMIHSDDPDVASLAVGQDLMTLGLDLNQAEPLHTSFVSPFLSTMSATPLDQDFALPACYKVANVQPLQSRIPSFSDETLFYIFYSMPRDVMQELVAEELMGRKWRYHKIERCWLTRDETYPGPVDVERGVSERGVYLLWDPASWKKVRREFILRYEDLDNRVDPNRGLPRAVGFPQHAS